MFIKVKGNNGKVEYWNVSQIRKMEWNNTIQETNLYLMDGSIVFSKKHPKDIIRQFHNSKQ